MVKVSGYITRFGVRVPTYKRRKRRKLPVKPLMKTVLKRRKVERDSYGRFYD